MMLMHNLGGRLAQLVSKMLAQLQLLGVSRIQPFSQLLLKSNTQPSTWTLFELSGIAPYNSYHPTVL